MLITPKVKDLPEVNTNKFIISTKASWALKRALGGEANVEEQRSLIGDAKTVKNETELKGMRACHIRDGAALIEFFAWLEQELQKRELNEVEAVSKYPPTYKYLIAAHLVVTPRLTKSTNIP